MTLPPLGFLVAIGLAAATAAAVFVGAELRSRLKASLEGEREASRLRQRFAALANKLQHEPGVPADVIEIADFLADRMFDDEFQAHLVSLGVLDNFFSADQAMQIEKFVTRFGPFGQGLFHLYSMYLRICRLANPQIQRDVSKMLARADSRPGPLLTAEPAASVQLLMQLVPGKSLVA